VFSEIHNQLADDRPIVQRREWMWKERIVLEHVSYFLLYMVTI